ncbi:hypothetical protein N431DRAFT_460874 [Stipitochalara longipes BDJ]|nr:hypothetical protein N431DRAFT_460874 [Stipitochalara longipes BDJ]
MSSRPSTIPQQFIFLEVNFDCKQYAKRKDPDWTNLNAAMLPWRPDSPVQLPDGRLACKPRGLLICGICGVGYSFMEEILAGEEETSDIGSGFLDLMPSLRTLKRSIMIPYIRRFVRRSSQKEILIYTNGARQEHGRRMAGQLLRKNMLNRFGGPIWRTPRELNKAADEAAKKGALLEESLNFLKFHIMIVDEKEIGVIAE